MSAARSLMVLGVVLAAGCAGRGEDAPPGITVTTSALPHQPPAQALEPPRAEPMAELQEDALRSAATAMNEHDAARFASLYEEGAVVRAPGVNELDGRDAIAKNMGEWLATFPHVKVGFRHAWLSEDVVVAEWVLAGTYTVSGTDGRQRPLGRAGLSILWFDKDGLVKEEHRYGNRGPAMTHAASATSVKRPKGAAELQTIPAGLEIEHASASADEEAHLRLAEGLYVALAEKNEADSVANLAGDIDYEGQLGRARGQSEARALFATMAHGFSQTKFAVEGGWAAGQYAIVEYELSGIDRVSLLGLAATNRPITLHAADVLEIVDGKIVQVQSYSNPLELMTELGALKDKLILR